VLVINSGGQDHRWLGNDYFKKKGAKVIASAAAVKDHKARLNNYFMALEQLVGKKVLKGTEESYADQVFDKALDITVGGVEFQLRHYGPAHTPGDSVIWLPQKQVVFTGDIVYVERMLGVGSMSDSSSWVKVFEEIEKLKPKHVVPGHGHATTMEKARADTYDYLVMLRRIVGEFLEQGGGAEDISKLDQSKFKYLKVYDQIKGVNALNVYIEMEFE
jgi:glyoxylase-like metal-dependent hydrolase (beta-lactamase superfamily II)